MFSSELWQKPAAAAAELTTKGIIAWGANGNTGNATKFRVSNLISTSGVVAADITGVGTVRQASIGATYSDDKGIFFGGITAYAVTNLVSNSGVVASDTTMVGDSSYGASGARFGGTKAIFAFGYDQNDAETSTNTSRIVDDNGVVGSQVSGVGTARYQGTGGVPYGGDKAVLWGGIDTATWTYQAISNLVSNTGVVSSDTAASGSGRTVFASATYGEDKGIFGFGRVSGGDNTGLTNLVSNTGAVASDTAAVGTARRGPGACGYGSDKGIFSFGDTAVTNLVSNSGVVASDVTQVGNAYWYRSGLGFAN